MAEHKTYLTGRTYIFKINKGKGGVFLHSNRKKQSFPCLLQKKSLISPSLLTFGHKNGGFRTLTRSLTIFIT